MDETPATDADCGYRALSVEVTQWLFERSDVHPADVGEFIAAATQIEHFITNGASVEFHCADSLRHTVRGAPDTQ